MTVFSIDDTLGNYDWIKANAFDFPSVTNLAEFIEQLFLPSDPKLLRDALASYAGMAWLPVAPPEIRDAIIVAVTELERLGMVKATFATRSEAGRYAANMRWAGHVKDEGSSRLKSAVAKATATMQNLNFLVYQQGEQRIKIDVADWDKHDEAVALDVVFPKSENNRFGGLLRTTVVGKAVIEAEKELNALGAQVMDEALARARARGTVTDEMIEAELSQDKDVAEAKKALKALDKKIASNDRSVLPVAMVQATEEEARLIAGYKESRQEGALIRSQLGDRPNRVKADELRAEMKEIDAKTREYELEANRATQDKDRLIRGWVPHQSLIDTLERPKTMRDAIQKAVAAEVFGLLAEHADTGKVSLGLTADSITRNASDGKSKEEVAAELNARSAVFPAKLIGDLKGHRVKVAPLSGSYSSGDRTINTSINQTTFEHELIHAISYHDMGTRLIEQAVLQRRTIGLEADSLKDVPFQTRLTQGPQKIRNATRHAGQVKGEEGYARYRWDKFNDGYMGRLYNRDAAKMGLNSTETLTVGFQHLVGGRTYLDAGGTADRDIVNTTVGWLFAVGR